MLPKTYNSKKNWQQKPPITSQPSNSQPSSSQHSASQTGTAMETPSQQKSMSEGIILGYTIYLLSPGFGGGKMPVIGIVEVKRKEDFNDKAICQTIGYHIVSRVSNIKQSNVVPPLLILICQDQLKFLSTIRI